MSKTIDEKVVEMRFDNSNFEKNVQGTLSTLDKLKQKLNLTGASKGLENINTAASKVDMSGMSNAIETVKVKFSALEVMGITALANITNSAVNTGKQLVKSLSIDQITAGWDKYGQKTASVQTIMNATGKSIDEVNGYLDKLMWFSDETSYGFTDMTAALAQMTSSGGDIDKLIPLITGVANATAYAGKGASEFSRVMYNLNQSYGAGYLQYMDWKSLELAGVASEQLKQIFIDTGVALGKIKKGQVTISNFGTTLSDKWATTEVMEKAFGKFGEMTEKAYEMVQNGEVDTASEAYAKLAEQYDGVSITAAKAAQEAKTFTEAIDATKDAVSSGWMKTFEIIFGNYDEAKVLWTDLANSLWDVFASGAEARNEMLQTWKELGGRDDLIESFWNTWEAVGSIIKPIKEAFKDIFPSITAERLHNITENLKEFTAKLKISDETADKLKRTFKGVFSIFDIGKKALTAVFKPLFEFLTGSQMSSIGSGILNITASIGDFFTKLNNSNSVGNAFIFIANGIAKALNFMGDIAASVFSKFDGIGGVLSKIGSVISKFAGIVKNVLGKAFNWIKENISMGDVFAGLTGAGIFMALKKLADLFDKVSGFFDKIGDTFKGLFKSSGTFKEIMGTIKETLTSFQQGIKVASLLGIAIAITLLSSSIRKLSEIKPRKIAVSLLAMQLMIMELNAGFKSLSKTLTEYPAKGTLAASLSLIAMAEAINILASVMKKMSDLSLPDIAKGLAGIGVCIYALSKSMRYISESKGIITVRDSIALIAMATACRILASSIKSIGSLPWDQWAKGLLGMGLCITALTLAIRCISNSDGKTLLRDSVILIAMATACRILASTIKSISSLSWEEWAKGMLGMGLCITALTASIRVINDSDGKTLLRDSIALIAMATACRILASAIKSIGGLSWFDWIRGLVGMGLCITALTASIKIISKSKKVITVRDILAFIGIATACKILASAIESIGYLEWDEWGRGLLGIGACIGALTAAIAIISKSKKSITVRDILAFVGIAAACKILASVLAEIGSMSWDGIWRGLTGMGLALAELTVVAILLGKFASGSALIGAASILIMSFSLGKIADALNKIGSMSWDEIWRGLTGMGLALVELGVVCGTLGSLTGIAGLVGAGTILLAVQGLDQLANALIKFGSMSWDEIGRGLAAMGGALGEIALGGLLNTLSGLGSLSISAIAEPLGTLADSFKKWGDIEYEDIATGLKAMNAAFVEIAAGGLLNTLSGLGSLSIATIAEPLGTLADSVMKWENVVIPEGLGLKLSELSGGIMSFTLSGLGAEALATAAPGIGQMADSVMKWQNVVIPEGIKDGLTNIADGIQAFSFAFMGGWSLSTVTGPLGDLPESLSKWKDVVIPEGIKDGLTNIADGIQAFSFAFMGGFSLSTIVGPLGDLSETIKKWSDVVVPDTIKDGLKSIADGINEFTIIGAAKLCSIADPLNTLSNAFKKFSTLSGDSSNMITVADNIKTCCDKLSAINTDSISKASSSIDKLANMFSKINSTNVSNVEKFVESANKLNEINIGEINVNTGSLQSAINAIQQAMKSIESTIKNSKTSISSAMEDAVSGLETAIDKAKSKTDSAINSLVSSMISKIKSKKSDVTSSFKTLVSGGADGIKDKKQSFADAGKYLGEGLIEGINSKKTDAYNAGYALGQAAVQGEKDGQQSNSPSKATIKAGKWLGEGLIIGIENMGKKVSNAGRNIGETATNSISHALDIVNNILNSDIDSQPTIKPVLDLSNVESGAGYLSSMFNNGPSLAVATNLGAISSGMNSRLQNGTTDDVISAINKLGKSLGNAKGDTYNIDGITYDDGSNITDAVKTLVRAAKMERRV